MWLEILLFRRYLVGIHYFYIYAKQRSKWNSGKINYSYLFNKIVVSHTSTMIMVSMNVLQFDVCSNCYVLVYWLPIYWEIYEMQYLGYLSVRRYNLVNSFSTAYPVVFQMPHSCHMACVEFTLAALVCSHCTCLIECWSYETRLPRRCVL